MKLRPFIVASTLPLALALAAPSQAAVTFYTSQSAFQSALAGSFTLVELNDNDDPSDPNELGDFGPVTATNGYRVEDTGPAAAFLGLGIDFVAVNAQVVLRSPNRMIANGNGFDGNIQVNFVNPVNGIGAFSNAIDFGRVRAFSEANLGGTFLGQQQFGPGSFGGLTSTIPINSVEFTCDFNTDLKCGVYDIQFGTFAADAAVPEPGTWALMILGFGLVGWQLRRQRGATMAVTA